MLRVGADLSSGGLLTMSQALKSDASGARITKQGESFAVRDDPIAEARELVGGYFC